MKEHPNEDLLGKMRVLSREFQEFRQAKPDSVSKEAMSFLVELQRLQAKLSQKNVEYLEWIHAKCDRYRAQVDILSDTITAITKVCHAKEIDETLPHLIKMQEQLNALDRDTASPAPPLNVKHPPGWFDNNFHWRN